MPIHKTSFTISSHEFHHYNGLPRNAVAKNISTRIRLDKTCHLPKPPSLGEIALVSVIAASILLPIASSLPTVSSSRSIPQSNTPLQQGNVTNITHSKVVPVRAFIPPFYSWERHIPFDAKAWGKVNDAIGTGAKKVWDFVLENPEIIPQIKPGGRPILVPKIPKRFPVIHHPKPPNKPLDSPSKPTVLRQTIKTQPKPPVKPPKQEPSLTKPDSRPCRVLGKVALATAVSKGSAEVSRTIVSQTSNLRESLNQTGHSINRTIKKEGERVRQEFKHLGDTISEKLDEGMELVANKTEETLENFDKKLTEGVNRVVNRTEGALEELRDELNQTFTGSLDRIDHAIETIHYTVTAGGLLRLGTIAIPTLVSLIAIIQNCCASRREKKMLETLKKIQDQVNRIVPETSSV